MRSRWLSILLLLLFMPLVQAKPMAGPTLEEGVKASSQIVVAQYDGYRAGPVAYLDGTTAYYHVTQSLKGPKPTGKLSIRYAFQDGTACIAPEGWMFHPNMMPKPGSTWILLLQPPGTYRGDFGRLPYTPENLARVKAAL